MSPPVIADLAAPIAAPFAAPVAADCNAPSALNSATGASAVSTAPVVKPTPSPIPAAPAAPSPAYNAGKNSAAAAPPAKAKGAIQPFSVRKSEKPPKLPLSGAAILATIGLPPEGLNPSDPPSKTKDFVFGSYFLS